MGRQKLGVKGWIDSRRLFVAGGERNYHQLGVVCFVGFEMLGDAGAAAVAGHRDIRHAGLASAQTTARRDAHRL